MEKIARTLEYSVNAINGAAVENNNFCVTVHYRNNPKVDMEIKLNSVIPFQNLKKWNLTKSVFPICSTTCRSEKRSMKSLKTIMNLLISNFVRGTW
jgi:hypothetical protein